MSKSRINKPEKKHKSNHQEDAGKNIFTRPVVLLAILTIAVAAITLIIHWPALSAEAVCFDDDQYLTDNHLVQNPGWPSAKQFLREIRKPSTVAGYYQPLNMISLMLDYGSGGRIDYLRPFHRTSLILHLCNTVLIIVLLYIIFHQPWVAAIVGLLFGVHPMTVENIPWVGERKTLLAAFFALWCLILYVRYTRTSGWKSYAMCLVLYFLALMSKPTSTPLPAVMLLMDFWPLKRLNKRAILEKIPFFVIAGVFAWITIVSQRDTASIRTPDQYGLARAPLMLCYNIIHYPIQMLWPANLTTHQTFPEPFDLTNRMVLIGVIGTCLLIPALVISLLWTRAPLTGWMIFFVSIFPTMGVISFTNVIASDKFAYLPSIGLLMLIAFYLNRLWKSPQNTTIKHFSILAVVLLLAGLEARTTRVYLAKWKNTETLFRHMLTVTPEAAVPHNCLALHLAREERFDEAFKYFEQALRLKPDYANAYSNMALALSNTGKIDKAIECYQKALKFMPMFPSALNGMGNALNQKGRSEEAIGYYKKALEIKPTYAPAINNLANTLCIQGHTQEAVQYFKRVLKLRPHYPSAYNNLGTALAKVGKTEEAISYYNQALQLKSDYYSAHNNLGTALIELGKVDEAIVHYKKAIEAKPDFARAYYNLGIAQVRKGNIDQAIQTYLAALKRDPKDPDTYCRIGDLLVRKHKFNQAVEYYRKAIQIDPQHKEARQKMNMIPTK
ncbi:MAG: tetratricopeptide repeat protein [Planctomycetota bacterium]|jgi:tetratricopeptide (TPR) repeat protein